MAMSWPHVMSLVPVRIRPSENTVSGNDDGLKMCVSRPSFVPADQLLAGERQCNHQELQVEPIRLEPEEQVDAEDDRERTEAERVGVAPRPGEQHVERVGEEELRGDERAPQS